MQFELKPIVRPSSRKQRHAVNGREREYKKGTREKGDGRCRGKLREVEGKEGKDWEETEVLTPLDCDRFLVDSARGTWGMPGTCLTDESLSTSEQANAWDMPN